MNSLERVRQYPKGTDLFTAPAASGKGERESLGPTNWPVIVFWDPPKKHSSPPEEIDTRLEDCSQQSGVDNDSDGEEKDPSIDEINVQRTAELEKPAAYEPQNRRRLLVARGKCKGKPATILIDGGAALDLIDAKFVKENGLPVANGERQKISLAGGQVQDASQRATATVRIATYREELRLHVTNLEHYDMILGKPWLTDNNPQCLQTYIVCNCNLE